MKTLSPAQKHLIAGLKLFSMEQEAIIGIVLMLARPEQQDAMMFWMAENEHATQSDILEKVVELTD